MRAVDILFDNPILIKHVRSRLRRGQVVATGLVVLVLAACIAWTGSIINWMSSTSAGMILIGIQVALVSLAGSSQINTSLGGARESGILDFHRVSPLPPAAVALGFFLGAPIREYLIAALTLPFAFFSAYYIDAFEPWKG